MKTRIVAVFAVTALTTGCGFGVSTDEAADRPTAAPADDGGTAMCAPDVTDCVDTVVDDQGDGDDAGTRPSDDTLRAEARQLLGTTDADLGDRARVGRRGDEHMMLTEDYQVGRFTVELDDDGTGTYRVTVVTVELGDGPETFRS